MATSRTSGRARQIQVSTSNPLRLSLVMVQLLTLEIASPSLYTMKYGNDGEGRWNNMQSSGTKSYVTATTYNATGQQIEIALTGTGPDQDVYVYDPNTGRMTKFTCK